MRGSSSLPWALVLFLGGCGHDSSPMSPESRPALSALQSGGFATSASQTKLDALWPNDDGRSWSYDYVEGVCGPQPPVLFFPDPSQVPAAPEPSEVVRLLPGDRPGPPLRGRGGVGTPTACLGVFGTLTFQFKGQTTTLSGATGQNLEETFQSDFSPRPLPLDGTASSRFLARLAEVRPDLRQRIGPTSVPPRSAFPLLIHGGAWEKTADHIGTYGDLDRNLAWKFLGADVSPGSSFDFQLVPSLAPDVVLHALVVERKDAARVKDYARDLEVVYVLDYGILAIIEGADDTVGYTRPVDYGSVIYVPDVGPVKDFERRGAVAGNITVTPGFVSMTLKSTSPGSTLPPWANPGPVLWNARVGQMVRVTTCPS